MKKSLVIAKLILLVLAALGLLLLIAALIAELAMWLTFLPMPTIVKIGLAALLALAIMVLPLVYARWQRHRRAKARASRTVIEALDDSDEMMTALELPRLLPGQRDVLRGTLDALLENWPWKQK